MSKQTSYLLFTAWWLITTELVTGCAVDPRYPLEWGSSCYFRSSSPNTLSQSRTKCQNHGSRLVYIESIEEQALLSKWMLSGSLTAKYWIGLTGSSPHDAAWLNGDPVSYSNFGTGAFTYNSGQYVTEAANGQWFDWLPSSNAYFICELEFGVTSPKHTDEPTTTRSATEQATTLVTTTTAEVTTQPSSTEQQTTNQAATGQDTTLVTTQSETTEQQTTAQPTTEQATTLIHTTAAEVTTQTATTEQRTTAQPTTERATTSMPTTAAEVTTQSSTTEQQTTAQPTTEQARTLMPTTTEQRTTPPTSTDNPSKKGVYRPDYRPVYEGGFLVANRSTSFTLPAPVMTYSGLSVIKCAFKCLAHLLCGSFVHDHGLEKCYIISGLESAVNKVTVNGTELVYYRSG